MMTVSKQTENFIECIHVMNELYDKVHDALESMYGTVQAERMIAEEFSKKFDGMSELIEQYMLCSIREHASFHDATEI